MKILALIPARGGSKGVPHKNIRSLCGKPVIAYSIQAAQEVKELFHRIIVSTDNPEIAEVSKNYGAEVPFMRPANLADDRSPTIHTVKHAVEFVEENDHVKLDWVCLLQPSDPLRESSDIKVAISLAQNNICDSVISVVQVFATHPVLMKKIEGNYLQPFCIEEKEGTRRQDYSPAAYMRNGAIYLTRRDIVMNSSSLWGEKIIPYIMPQERSVGIDSEIDFKVIEELMKQKQENLCAE